MVAVILDKIIEIEKTLYRSWKTPPFVNDISLMTGISGLPIFYCMLYNIDENPIYVEKIEEIVNKIFEQLNSNSSNNRIGSTFSSGIAGIGYVLNLIEENGVLKDIDLTESLNVIDEILLDTVDHFVSYVDELEHKYKIEQIDFLHGVLGIAYYLLNRLTNGIDEKKVIQVFEKISEIVIDDCELAIDMINVEEILQDHKKTNLGLAHGHTSYILIFSKFLEKFPNNEKAKEVVSKSAKLIMSFKNDDESNICVFPSIAVNKKTAFYKVHLGWCYGDQAIAYGLYKAGEVLKDSYYINESIEIAKLTFKRNSVSTALLNSDDYDAGFCHGTSSVAFFHKKWYKIAKNEMFEDLYNKFIFETLIAAKHEQGMAGFLKHDGKGDLVKAIGMLDGIAGIGVVLIDYYNYYLKNEVNLNWQSMYLLN